MTLEQQLKSRLNAAKKIAVLGVGSELKGDDCAGILVAGQVGERENLKVFLGSTAPENLTGEIRKFAPTHTLIIDSASFQERAGTIKIFSAEEIGGMSFSTHRLPLKFLADYLSQTIGCEVIFIGIQPQNTEFNTAPSKAVAEAVAKLGRILGRILKCPSGN